VHQWLPGEDDADGWAPRVGERREGKRAAARAGPWPGWASPSGGKRGKARAGWAEGLAGPFGKEEKGKEGKEEGGRGWLG